MASLKSWECKLQCLQKQQEEAVRLNPLKLPVPENSIIKITSKGGGNSKHVFAKATSFDKDLKNYGLSMEMDMSKEFGFQNNGEVVVEVVEHAQCEIQMLEVTCADQYVGRGDMLRFKHNLRGTCTYRKKHMLFSGISVQVRVIFNSEGEQMESGYITKSTHITYRSQSSFTQLFIQIGKEMWENDYEGMENWENFEKVVYQFVKTLFDRWEQSKANHDLQIIFFTRIFFEVNKYPEYKASMIQFDGEGRPFLDIYDIVCDGGNITDVKPIIGLMKRRFNKLGLIIADMQKDFKVEVSSSSKGNFLECINLALDQYTNHFQDRVHYRTGQQIVVVTAGSGMFYVDRELANFTKHRVLDIGVGADVVCLGKKPLHATPLFVFQTQQMKKGEHRIFDRYQVPHWMNMHFYAINNQPGKFVPIMGLSSYDLKDKRIIPFRGPAPSLDANLESCSAKQLGQLCEEYDESLMKCPSLQLHVNHSSHYDIPTPELQYHTPSSYSSDTETQSCSYGTTPIDRRRTIIHLPSVESNPFKPSSLPRPVTNSRRRWAHAFPSAVPSHKNWHGLSRSLRIEQDYSADHVDWQSLITPACFPISTDYYPDSERYKETFYTLSSDDIKQLQKEIIVQRLSRGFQIVVKKNQSKNTVTVSLGDSYHDIKLQDNYTSSTNVCSGTINVTISKPEKKAQFPEKIYKYCLIPYLGTFKDIDGSLINCQSERTTREEIVDARWNNFDMYVLRLLEPDLGEEMRPLEDSIASQLKLWRSRYVIVPRPDWYFHDHNVNDLSHNEEWVIHNFYNILFAMNNIKYQDIYTSEQRRLLNVSGPLSLPSSPSYMSTDEFQRPRTGTLVSAKSFNFSNYSDEEKNDLDHSKNSSVLNKLLSQKSATSSSNSTESLDHKVFKECMLSKTSGMKFISTTPRPQLPGQINTQPNLPPNTFIASYLVDFVRKTRDENPLEFCEELLKHKIIEETNFDHDSNYENVSPTFIDGFYFYNLVSEKSPTEKSFPRELLEVANSDVPSKIKNFEPKTEIDLFIQSAERVGDRQEFFTVGPDSCYHPQHAYGFTVKWDRATAQLIELCYLSKWRMKAEKSGFQLVQVPTSPFDSPNVGEKRQHTAVAPFRAPIDIPIASDDIDSIHGMLYQFGFLHDFPAGTFPDEKLWEIKHRKHDFVHLSGIALVRVCIKENPAVLKWASNPFLGSKKWHPRVFLPGKEKEEKFYQMSFEELLNRFRKHLEKYFQNN